MFWKNFENYTYAVLRIVTGFLFFWHGSQKLFDYPPSGHIPSFQVMWIAGPIEFLGGVLLVIGLWSRWAAFVCCGLMAYAYWTVHGMKAILPIVNHGESAFLYCFLFLFIFAKGSGSFSLDSLIFRKNKPERQT